MTTNESLSPAPYGYRRLRASVPVATLPKRDRGSKLESFKPLVLCPQNWPQLLRDDHPLGAVLDFGRG